MTKTDKVIKNIYSATAKKVEVFRFTESSLQLGLKGQSVVESDGKIFFLFVQDGIEYYGVFDKESDQDVGFARLFITMFETSSGEDFEKLEPEEKLKLLLTGELSAIKTSSVKTMMRDMVYSHYAVYLVAESRTKREELESFIDTMKEQGDYVLAVSDEEIAYFKVRNSGYENALDFAQILYESIKEELRIDLYVAISGSINTFEEFSHSYLKAKTAIFYGKMLFPNERIFDFKEFALPSVLSSIPKEKLAQLYYTILGDVNASVWEDEELLTTAEAFIRCSLNVSQTSRHLYVHRNTLMYRLDKIKRETGYDLRNFSDACAFNLINVTGKILKG